MLLFLDIDGVMVPARSWEKPALLSDGFPAFTAKATSVLQHLLADDVTIMLTTSHKGKYTIEEWKAIFKKRGINTGSLGTLSENTGNLSRKDEVLNWFNTNTAPDHFLIIDDDKSLNALPHFLKQNLLLTSSSVGLTNEYLPEIESILHAGKELQPA